MMKLMAIGTVLATIALAVTLAGQDVAREQKLQQAIDLLETKGDIARAVPLLEEVAKSSDQALAARGLLYLGQAQERQGTAEAAKTYERIIREFASHDAIVDQARARLAAIGGLSTVRDDHRGRRQIVVPDTIGEYGMISPDGQLMSFYDVANGASGNLGIWDLRSGRTDLVTDAPCCDWAQGYAEASAWSPDGQQLAFAWRGIKNGGVDLKLVPRQGGRARVLFDGPSTSIRDAKPGDITWIYPFAWSRDGRSILAGFGTFVSAGVVGHTKLVLVAIADGSVTTLKELGRSFPANAMFSPDGRYIVYDYPPAGDDRRDVFIMSADGSGHRPLVEDSVSDDTVLTWVSAKRVVYTSDRMGTRDAWAVDVADGQPVRQPVLVKRAVGDSLRSLGMTKDGSLVTAAFIQLSDVWTATIDPLTARTKGQLDPLPRPQTGMVRSQATWSPDGARIAYFQSPRSSGLAPSLAIQDARTAGTRQYPLTIQNPERIVWRPDGKAIVFNAAAQEDKGGERLFSVDLETGTASVLGPGVQAAFSPDGRFLYHPRAGTLIRRELSSGHEEVVHRGAGVGRALVMSPDGERLATFLNGVVVAVPAGGGEPRTLMDKVPNGGTLHNPLAWSRDGKYLFVASASPSTVWRISLDTGKVVDTGINISGVIKRLSHGPDERLAISVARGASEIWVEHVGAWIGQR